MGEGGRKDSRGNIQQTIGAEMNIHGEDIQETNKNERTEKTVVEVHQKSSKNRHCFFNRVIPFKKCPVSFQKLGRMG